MRMRELGRTGLRVSALGFGAGALGDHYFPTEEADNRGHAVLHLVQDIAKLQAPCVAVGPYRLGWLP